ncbi:MAG: pirin family protein [Gammaproteobacteria bacterium]|nr:pirin family protein [Gammaproteobacteria bacterium]
MTRRPVAQVIDTVQTLEGGGFPVRRPFPVAQLLQFDPFLLFDHLGPVTWGPGQGIGAPDHPHRGFETVTYLLSGEMQHKDSAGRSGTLRAGDVQWMTAGRGVVHSEMPTPEFQRSGGIMHGFQLWVNLPAKDKMMPPRYQDIPAAQIPEAMSADGKVKVRVIAGSALGKHAVIEVRTPIIYLHYTLRAGGETAQDIPADYNAMVYVIRGAAAVGDPQRDVREGQAALLGPGASVQLAAKTDTDVLVLAGVPLNEPVARHGPFVMNTAEEIQQAIRDYREGRMGQIA